MSPFPNSSRKKPINAAMQSEHPRLAGISPAKRRRQPYRTVLRAFVQQRPATPAQRERLIQRIEAALCSED